MAHPRTPDLISIVEAVYDVEQTRDAWLSGILASISANMPGVSGVGGILYRIGEDELELDAAAAVNTDPKWLEIGRASHSDPITRRGFQWTYQNLLCADMVERAQRLPNHEHLAEAYRRSNIEGCLLLNGYDPGGFGCGLYLFGATRFEANGKLQETYQRIATHLATAYRLQRRLGDTHALTAPRAEAVIDPAGKFSDLSGKATEADGARSISIAFQDRERARKEVRHSDPPRAISLWRGMVTGRWTLVDKIERDGRRYVIARENIPAARGPEALSERERQVTALAALGRHNKLIAYELGLAPATVRVLLARACAKTGAKSRIELIERYRGFLGRVAIAGS